MHNEEVDVSTDQPLILTDEEQNLIVTSGLGVSVTEPEQVIEITQSGMLSFYETGASGDGYMSDQRPDTTSFGGLAAERNFVRTLISWIETNVPNRHKLTRVYRATVNDFEQAVCVGDSQTQAFTDVVEPGIDYFYWLVGETYAGKQTVPSESIGVVATEDSNFLLDLLGLKSLIDDLATLEDKLNQSYIGAYLNLEELAAQNLASNISLINESIATVTSNMVQIEQRLGLESENALALLEERLTVAVDESNALIERVNTLTAKVTTETEERLAQITRLELAQVTADSALTQTRDELNASIANERSLREASVVAERTARVNAVEVVASSVESLNATFQTEMAITNAAIDSERIARTTANAATAQQITDISTGFDTARAELDSRITQELTSQSTATEAVASALTELETQVTTDLARVESNVAEELTSYSDELESVAGQMLTLEANFQGLSGSLSQTNALITEESTTRANEYEALAQRTSKLEADFSDSDNGELVARIETEETARADADGALSSRIDELDTKYTGKDSTTNARITDEVKTLSDANQALSTRTSTLEASYEELDNEAIRALVDTETTARTTQDQALAKDITDLSAQMGTDIGTAKAEAEQYTLSVVGYCTIGGTISDDTTQESCEANGGTWSQLPLSEAMDRVSVSITKPDGTVVKGNAGSFFQALTDDVGNISTRAFLGTDVNGRVTGVVATDSSGGQSQSNLDLLGSKVNILNDETLQPFISFDTVNKRGVIRGQLILDDGTAVATEDDIRGLDGSDGTDGDTVYVEYQYSVNGSSNWHSPMVNGDVFRRERTVTNGSGGTWSSASRIKGDQGTQGPKGDQGVQGPAGSDGKANYFHIAYADSSDGQTNFNQQSGSYVGTYVDGNPTDSNNPSDYKWVLWKGVQGNDGTDGIPGVDGVDGETSYLHIAYADSVDGSRNFNQQGGDYIGQYVDFVQQDSTDYRKYTWTKIKGEVGPQGPTGPRGTQGPAGADGESNYFHIAYANNSTGTSGFNQTSGKYVGTYVDGNPADSSDPSKYKWKLWEGAQGQDGSDGIPGVDGVDGKTSYLHIAYADNSTGTSNFNQTSGKYIGTYVDFTKADSSDASKYTWKKFEGIDGKDGKNGTDGKDGETGPGFYTIVNSSGNFPANSTATSNFTSTFGFAPKKHDHLTYKNSANTNSTIKRFNGSTWTTPSLVVNGDILTKGTVTAEAINVEDLFAQDITATGTISGLSLTGARIEARNTSSGKSVLLDSGLGSPIIVNDGTNDVLRFDSNNKLILDAGLGAGTIDDPSVFSQAIWDQIRMPVTEGSTGGSFTGPDRTGQASTAVDPVENELISTITVTPTNKAPIAVSFRFYDKYHKRQGGNTLTNTKWNLAIGIQTRSSSSAAWSELEWVRISEHNGVEDSYGFYITELNIAQSFNIADLVMNGQCLVTVKITNKDFAGWVAPAGSPKLSNVTAIQQVQGGGAAGAASTLNGQEGAYYLNYANFSGSAAMNQLTLKDANKGIYFNHSGYNDAGGIRFKGSNGNDGSMEFWTSDDYDEPFRWRMYDQGLSGTGAYRELMTLFNNRLDVPANINFRDTSLGDADGYFIGRKNGTGGTTVSSLTDVYIEADQNGNGASQSVRIKAGQSGKELRVTSGTTSFGGQYVSESHVISGSGRGGAALTINDGQGNANVTFNHVNGVPEINGNSGRIEFNKDGTSNAGFSFEVASNVTAGKSVATTPVLWLSASAFEYKGHALYHEGHKPTPSEIGAANNSHSHGEYVVKNSNARLNSLNVYNGTNGNGATIAFSDNSNDGYKQQGFIQYYHGDGQVATGSQDGFIISGNAGNTVVRIDGRLDIGTDEALHEGNLDFKVPTLTYKTSSTDLSNYSTKASGFNTTSVGQDIGLSNGWHHVIHMHHSDDNGYAGQLALAFGTTANFKVRSAGGGGFGSWATVWTSHSDGAGSGLDADKLDGLQADDFMRRKSRSNYWGLAQSDGNDNGWIRVPKSGLLPWDSGVNSSLGSASWYFDKAFIKSITVQELSKRNSVGLFGSGTGTGGDFWDSWQFSGGTFYEGSTPRYPRAAFYYTIPSDNDPASIKFNIHAGNSGTVRSDINITPTNNGTVNFAGDLVMKTGTKWVNNVANRTRHVTDHGYIEFGPYNTAWAHFVTDRNAFHMNKSLSTTGSVKVYQTNSELNGVEVRVGVNNNTTRMSNDGAIYKRVSGWANNNVERAILKQSYVGTVGDYLQLHATGNGNAAGAILIGTSAFSVGRSNYSNPNSNNTAPFSEATWMTVTSGDLYLQQKRAIRFSDGWLRINEDKSFSSGIYCGGSTLRTDGSLQVGNGGSAFNVSQNQIDLKVTTRVHGYMKVKDIRSQDGNYTTIGAGELGNDLYGHVKSKHGAGNEGVHIGGEHGVYLYAHPNNMTGGMSAGYSIRPIASDGATYINHLDVYKDQNNGSQVVARFRHPTSNPSIVLVAKNRDEGSFRIESNNEGQDIRIQRCKTNGDYDGLTLAYFYRNGDMRVTREVTAQDFIATSDRRVKENLEEIDRALDKVDKLQGYTYDQIQLGQRKAGLIAQDVQEVLPEAVTEDKEGKLSVSPMAVIGLLTNAIKELKHEINQMKQEGN